MDNFLFYPSVDDDNFYRDIYVKEEFNKTKYSEGHYDKKKIEDVCTDGVFNLQNHQEFLHNFMSPETPWNSILLFHGVGTGKTCGALTIAEGYKSVIMKQRKKIKIPGPGGYPVTHNYPGVYVISGRSVRKVFMNELYSNKKAKKEDIPGSFHCVGNEYFPLDNDKDDNSKVRKAYKNIRGYYEFFGPLEFSNFVDNRVKKVTDDIGEFFSNSVFIIDEAHGLAGEEKKKEPVKVKKRDGKKSLRSDQEDDIDDFEEDAVKIEKGSRGSLAVLEEVFKKSKNTKLIMLSATPMRDIAEQFVDLLDLLRVNDGRSKVDIKKLFPSENSLNENYLKEMAKGYVSYLRGNNPVSFPELKEASSGLYTPSPKYDITGKRYKADPDMFKLLKSRMSNFQFYWYIQSKKKDKLGSDQTSRQASNIVFPGVDGAGIYGKEGLSGSGGALRVVNEYNRVGRKQVITKHYEYNDYAKDFLLEDNIGIFSTKFKKLMENINSKSGLHFVYTEFESSGALAIALMLEANGYVRHVDGLKRGKDGKVISSSASSSRLLYGNKVVYRCSSCGKLSTDPVHKDSNTKFHKFSQGSFILFTGDEQAKARAVLDDYNSPENKNGELVKVVIGTSIASEGVDYKRIRHIHIVNPWHNYTRIHQAIGRGLRHCSQFDLPKKEQGVTVYRYSATVPDIKVRIKNKQMKLDFEMFDSWITGASTFEKADKISQNGISKKIDSDELNTETSDEKVYRHALEKDKFVKKLERTLKVISVDCAINKGANIYKDDKDGSRDCDYQSCNYKCEFEPEGPVEINKDTYNIHFDEPEIKKVIKMFYSIFRSHYALKLNDIIDLVHKKNRFVKKEHIYLALGRLIGNIASEPHKVADKFGRTGTVIYRNGFYVYQPDDIEDKSILMRYRKKPLTIKKSSAPLATLISQKVAKKSSKEAKKEIDDTTSRDIITVYNALLNRVSDGLRLFYHLDDKIIFNIVCIIIDKDTYETFVDDYKKKFPSAKKKDIDNVTETLIEQLDNSSILLWDKIDSKSNASKYWVKSYNKGKSTAKLIGHINLDNKFNILVKGKWKNLSQTSQESYEIRLFNEELRDERDKLVPSNSIAGIVSEQSSGAKVFKLIDISGANIKNKKVSMSNLNKKNVARDARTNPTGMVATSKLVPRLKEILQEVNDIKKDNGMTPSKIKSFRKDEMVKEIENILIELSIAGAKEGKDKKKWYMIELFETISIYKK